MTQKAKASQSAVRSVTQVVLFGLDESGKPKAARFSESQAEHRNEGRSTAQATGADRHQ